MGRTPHEVSGLRKAGDHPARRALPFAGAPHPGETRHSQGDFLSMVRSLSHRRARCLRRSLWIARGVNDRPVRADRIPKSLGAESTFSADIFTFEAACEVLQPIIEKVWRTCEGAEIRGRTVTLKVKYADFQQITRSRTGQALFSTRAEIEQLSYALLEPLFPVTKGIRLLGITLSSLAEKQLESDPQLNLSF